MASVEEIGKAIESNLAHMGSYSLWTIGIADYPEDRHAKLEYPAFWRIWQAENEEDARKIQQSFVDKGMKHDGEWGRHPVSIYVF